MTRHPLHCASYIHHRADSLASGHSRGELWRKLERSVNGYVELGRHQLGYAVNIAVVHLERPTDVPDSGACGHGAERDDLRDSVGPVLVRDVIYDLAASLPAEVDVNVGHGDALGVEKPLKQQVVPERIDIRNAQAVCD